MEICLRYSPSNKALAFKISRLVSHLEIAKNCVGSTMGNGLTETLFLK